MTNRVTTAERRIGRVVGSCRPRDAFQYSGQCLSAARIVNARNSSRIETVGRDRYTNRMSTSPRIAVRVSQELHTAIESEATRVGVTTSVLVQEALAKRCGIEHQPRIIGRPSVSKKSKPGRKKG